MKKIVTISLLLTLLASEYKLIAPPEEMHTSERNPTAENIHEHNHAVLDVMDETAALHVIKNDPKNSNHVSIRPGKKSPNFVDSIDKDKGGISFGKNKTKTVKSRNGSKAQITTNEHGEIVKSVISHPSTSTWLGLPKTTATTTIEYHNDGTRTITKNATLNTGLFGPKHSYTEITKNDPDSDDPTTHTTVMKTSSAFGNMTKEVHSNIKNGETTTKNGDRSYKKESSDLNSKHLNTSHFDSQGLLKSEIISDNNNKPISQTSKIVTNSDGSITRHINNADGTKTTRLTDKNGKVLTEETVDPKHNNRPIKRVTAIPKGKFGQEARTHTFEINHDKNERTDTNNYQDGSSDSVTTNAENKKIKSVIVDKDGKKATTTYDADGKIIKTTTITKVPGNKGEVHETVHTGGSTITDAFNENGVKTTSITQGKVTDTESEYDAKTGHLKNEKFSDKEGNPLTHTEVDEEAGHTIITHHDIDTHQPASISVIDHKTGTTTTHSVNKDGNAVETTINPETGSKEEIETDVKHKEKITSQYNDHDELQSQVIPNSETGKKIEDITVDPTNGNKTKTQYDDDEKIISQNTENADGETLSYTEFNKDGSSVTRDAETDKVISHTAYDKDGVLQKYDKKNEPTRSGADSPRSVTQQ